MMSSKINLNDFEEMQDELLEEESLVIHNPTKKKPSKGDRKADRQFREMRKNRHNIWED